MSPHFVIVVFGVTIVSFGLGAEAAEPDAHQQKRIRYLVSKLVSTNEPPQIDKRRGLATFSPDYSLDAQAVVFLSIQQLFQEGSAAFDVLIEHSSDDHYSYSYDTPAGIRNRNVGSACLGIVQRQVQCYVLTIPLISSDQWTHPVPSNKKAVEMWWKDNRERPLLDLQSEAIERQLEHMKMLDHEKSAPSHPEASKMPLEKFNLLRSKGIETLERMRSTIEGSKEPFRPQTIDDYYSRMIKLPWPTRGFGN